MISRSSLPCFIRSKKMERMGSPWGPNPSWPLRSSPPLPGSLRRSSSGSRWVCVSEYAEWSIRGDIGIYGPEVDGEGPEEFHGRVHDIALDSLEDFMKLSGREARLSGTFDDLDDDIKFGPLPFSLNYPMALIKIFGTLVEIPPHPFTGSYSRSRHIAPSF